MTRSLTAILTREGNGFVSLCPELDIASQGANIDEARENLKETLELFFECASPEEVAGRLSTESYVTSLEVGVAKPPAILRPRYHGCFSDSQS